MARDNSLSAQEMPALARTMQWAQSLGEYDAIEEQSIHSVRASSVSTASSEFADYSGGWQYRRSARKRGQQSPAELGNEFRQPQRMTRSVYIAQQEARGVRSMAEAGPAVTGRNEHGSQTVFQAPSLPLRIKTAAPIQRTYSIEL